MWPRVSQMSRTLLFYTHFSRIRYQIKAKNSNANGQTYRIIFVSSVFEVYQFFPGEAKLFGASLVELAQWLNSVLGQEKNASVNSLVWLFLYVIFLPFRLWESGWKERYYENKFDVNTDDTEFRDKVVRSIQRIGKGEPGLSLSTV